MSLRPAQLEPSADIASKALQGFITVMGQDPGSVDGQIGSQTLDAYRQLQTHFGFLPNISENAGPAELSSVMAVIDQSLQDNVAFQDAYVRGIQNQSDTLALQGALVAGGVWVNRHLGDRISEAEPINMDGDRGRLTERGVRNGVYMVGVSHLQSSLNLLEDAGVNVNGIMDASTREAMRNYAQNRGIELSPDLQNDFLRVNQYILENELDNLRGLAGNALATDGDTSQFDTQTRDAQIVMNYLAGIEGKDVRTAPDGLQTDSAITLERSHTRTVIAPAVGVVPEVYTPETVVRASTGANPYGLSDVFEVTRADVLSDVSAITNLQQSNPESPGQVLAYSEAGHCYVLISGNEGADSQAYQISDTNVDHILAGVQDGSIALDHSAQKQIALELHGDSSETVAYDASEIREAFGSSPQRFTVETQEELMTTQAQLSDGSNIRFGLDDLHDALDQMDSKFDWPEAQDPIAVRDYVRDLRQAVEDGREERPVTMPQWRGGELDTSNSVEISVNGQTTRVPQEVWDGLDAKLTETESGYSVGEKRSALRKDFNPTADGSAATLSNQDPAAVEAPVEEVVTEQRQEAGLDF